MDVILHGGGESFPDRRGVGCSQCHLYLEPVSKPVSAPFVHPSVTRPTADSVVVIPTYNECENITAMVHSLKNLPVPVDVLVVDDNSPDGTAEVVMGLIKTTEGLFLLKRSQKTGLGGAYKAGFAFVLRHGWNYIVQMDADFSHNPRDVPRLLQACKAGADVVIGSRYIKEGRIEGWPWKRWLLSRCANLFAQIMLGCGIQDMTAGFKCFQRKALQSIDLTQVTSEGYVFQVEMNYRFKMGRKNIQQVPICFTDRQKGLSKMNIKEPCEAIKQLFSLKRITEL